MNFNYQKVIIKIIKFYKSHNFLSFTLNSRIRYYMSLIVFLICVLLYTIVPMIIRAIYENNKTEEKKIYNETNYYKKEKHETEVPLGFILFIALTWFVSFLVILFICYFFKNFKKRIDIIKKDTIVFIGITSFFQKSYIKHFIFNYNSIEGFKLTRKSFKNATLELKLEDEKIQKICDFTGESKEDLDLFEKKLNELI